MCGLGAGGILLTGTSPQRPREKRHEFCRIKANLLPEWKRLSRCLMRGDVRGALRCPEGQETKERGRRWASNVKRGHAEVRSPASRGTSRWRIPLIRDIRQGAALCARVTARVCDNQLCRAGHGGRAWRTVWRFLVKSYVCPCQDRQVLGSPGVSQPGPEGAPVPFSRGAAAGTEGRDVVRGGTGCTGRDTTRPRDRCHRDQVPTWHLQGRSFLPWFAHSQSSVWL